MNSQLDIFETQEANQVRSWLSMQDETVREAAALVVARLRIFEATSPLFSMLYAHSESKRNAVLSALRTPSVGVAFQALGLDPERLFCGAEFEILRLGTTRPDDYWRSCGVGRPKGKK